jgi:hypothetical protein
LAECPLCRRRKGRRACPAKGASICPHCCGTKRRVEIACPEDCVYLGGGHAPAWEGRETEKRRDARLVAPHLDGLSEAQGPLLILALSGIAALWSRRRDLDDRLLGQALAALRSTVDTRTKGILYDHAAESIEAQTFVPELRRLFEARDEDGVLASPADADLLPVLRALEAMVSEASREGSGPTAFLETATRLVGRLGPPGWTAPAPLIVEP